MKYDVKAVVEGESTNEVASSILAAAYLHDIDITALEVSLRGIEVNDTDQPISTLPGFQFPHVKTLIDNLNSEDEV